MPSSTDREAFAVAWRAWVDRSAAPSDLVALVDRLRAAADREVCATASGAARAEALAEQIRLAAAAHALHAAAAPEQTRAFVFSGWEPLAALALAEGAAGTELVDLAVVAGGGTENLSPACLAALAPLLDPRAVETRALAALASEALDPDDEGLLFGLLSKGQVGALLPARIERAAAIEDATLRWSALLGLVAHVPPEWERRAIDESRARHGLTIEEAYLGNREPDAVLEQMRIDAERARWGAPFTAWRLGAQARDLPEAERGPLLERALEEFAAIARTPTSPGNDEGPFWAIARLLDEPRVRRALAIVEDMDGADWRGDLGASRAALLARLARLGHVEEAERTIARIGVDAPLADHWRAVAWGGVLGARMALDPTARFDELLAGTADDPAHLHPEWRFRVLERTVSVFEGHAPPPASNVEALLALALSFEPALRRVALVHLIANLLGALPLERWLEVIHAEQDQESRIEAWLALAEATRDVGRDPSAALVPLLASLDEHPCEDPVGTFRDLVQFRAWLTPQDALARWCDFLRHAADAGASHAVADVRASLPEIVVWLAGPEARLTVVRALASLAEVAQG